MAQHSLRLPLDFPLVFARASAKAGWALPAAICRVYLFAISAKAAYGAIQAQ
jgi:hypothetical protein